MKEGGGDLTEDLQKKILSSKNMQEFIKEDQIELDYEWAEQYKEKQIEVDIDQLDLNKYPRLETVGILAEDYEERSIYSEDEGIDDYK